MFDGLDVNKAVDLFTTLFLSIIARHVPDREITTLSASLSNFSQFGAKFESVDLTEWSRDHVGRNELRSVSF